MSMDDTNALIKQRKEKLEALRAKGIDPFKNKFAPTEKCAEARANYAEGREVALAGRITAHRDMGKSQFIDIKDQSGRIQVYAQKQALGDEQFEIFKHLDLGDFVGVRGTLFTTKTGEISVKLAAFFILAKALRPVLSDQVVIAADAAGGDDDGLAAQFEPAADHARAVLAARGG